MRYRIPKSTPVAQIHMGVMSQQQVMDVAGSYNPENHKQDSMASTPGIDANSHSVHSRIAATPERRV